MIKRKGVLILFLALLMIQCRAYRYTFAPEAPAPLGMEGLHSICVSSDTIHSITISKAEALISTDEERYETQVTLYAIRDSLISLSAVNNGFEVLRAAADPDTIRVIDRLNKVVYRTPVKRRFGHQNPVNFEDVQNLVLLYNLCDDLECAKEVDLLHVIFNYSDEKIKKQISLDRNTLKMDRFEFYHMETGKYIMGERSGESLRIYSNFMITEFEIMATGGEIIFNQEIPVKMNVNPRRYTLIDL
jgi:hypothetical protein